ncbi:head-tail connector protein [Litorimonas haliclonae]|uniref:head-tail connector protein n=1 Tax=Litorimonas haliclonae TaxID=2081977 RepID=UPI0039EDF90E
MITDIMPPPIEPITLEAAKLFLRLDDDAEDTLITDLIQSAREQVETLCRKTLIERPQRVSFASPFNRILYLNIAPIKSVTAMTLHLENGGEEAVSLDGLKINFRATPASIQKDTLGLWSWHHRPEIKAITVDVVAGYGESIDDIPMPLRQAMLLLIGQGYEHRAGIDMPGIPMMVDALVMPYRSLKL